MGNLRWSQSLHSRKWKINILIGPTPTAKISKNSTILSLHFISGECFFLVYSAYVLKNEWYPYRNIRPYGCATDSQVNLLPFTHALKTIIHWKKCLPRHPCCPCQTRRVHRWCCFGDDSSTVRILYSDSISSRCSKSP